MMKNISKLQPSSIDISRKFGMLDKLIIRYGCQHFFSRYKVVICYMKTRGLSVILSNSSRTGNEKISRL